MMNPSLPSEADLKTVNCSLNFSKEIANAIFNIDVVLGSIGCLLSLFATGLIILFKFYKKFVYRLVMYLIVVNTVNAVCVILWLIPVEATNDNCIKVRNGRGWAETCAALGYLDMVMTWIRNFVIIWTMVYMLKLSWQLRRLHSNQQANSINPIQQLHKHPIAREIAVLIVLVFSPFLFCWFPFEIDMYGLSGPWCFIRTVSDDGDDGKHFQAKSLTLMVVMYFGPVVGIVIFVLTSMIFIMVVLWRSSKSLHGAVRLCYENNMKQIGFVLIYPLIYCLFCLLSLVNRVYSAIHTYSNHNPPNYPLWIIHAVADPSLSLIPALAFLLHPHVWKKVKACRASPQNPVSMYTKYSVPPEDDDISEGYTIRPTSGLYGSINNSVLFLTRSK